MTWAKLDDRLYDDPRCEAAGSERVVGVCESLCPVSKIDLKGVATMQLVPEPRLG